LASLFTSGTCPDKGSSTASNQNVPSIPEVAQNSSSLRRNTTGSDVTKLAFESLEQTFKTLVKNKYKRRVQEGYNLPGSPTYEAWKTLYNATVSTTISPPLGRRDIRTAYRYTR
jgi:hypothetical protein